MNLITHNKAYSIFPRETFEERCSLIFAPYPDSSVQARIKYEKRGWEFITKVKTDEFQNSTSGFVNGSRYLGDPKCWTIPLYPDLDFSPRFWEANSWSLSYDVESNPMHIWDLIQCCLYFSYLIDVSFWFWPNPDKYEDTDDET